ncbi:gliding motility-associated C-terminal domain-containing protein [Hymenobacter busanensis]|uniref:Gliding motility-associated C-terminal domain-containing protein n=1 Tax=Hymenobacter busanensis TaxID=2607656 RepID=A0A7L5A1N6_9BACT|nr:gliding motility-associated C-terminal domain-containing protein [Hymenobacter busanensis]KAA9332033.1 gliding motility-associated C-terminal domain-containing protein [Hymenobacter busanensis]QHJ07630.1 T9SS type B sorting domain-containing protein [Hymenobacter busanensis]
MRTFLLCCTLLMGWLLAARPAAATHLVGGEMSYKYLDDQGGSSTPFRYQFLATVYYNKEVGSAAPDGRPSITVNIYNRSQPALLVRRVVIVRTQFQEITAALPAGCAISVPRVTMATYNAIIELPYSATGFQAIYGESARNVDIGNIDNAGGTGMALTMDITPTPIRNATPVFSDMAVAVICQNDTSFVLNNAFDADGDRLSYSFGTPYSINNAGALLSIDYVPGFSQAAPFGPTGYAALNAATGLASYLCRIAGRFVVAVDVREYRTINGQEVLLGTIRRDVQLVVRRCPGSPALPPAFTPATLARRSYTVEEGQEVVFPIEAVIAGGQPLTLKVSSALLDGAGPYDASFNNNAGSPDANTPLGAVTLTGQGAVGASFRFRAGCGSARATPYDVLAAVQNNVCGGRNIGEVFRIQVTRAAGAVGGIEGDAAVCAFSSGSYTARGLTSPQGFLWSVRGGTIVGPATGATVQVQWGAQAAGRLTVRGISTLGCPTDSVAQVVMLQPGPPISGTAFYCPQTSTGLRYSVVPEAGAVYQWSVSPGTVVGGQGTANVEVNVPNRSTAILRVLNTARPGCAGQLTIAPDMACLAFYNVITPNGDGLNDAFVIENLGHYPGSGLRIYNRWGQQLYQTADYRNDWRGEAQSAGTYYYYLQVSDGRVFKGWFDIVR